MRRHLADRVVFRGHGWFAMLDANPIVPGHTILVRETPGSCPDALTAGSLENVHVVAPQIAGWDRGHLHQFLGDQDLASSIRNQQERIDRGWTEEEQRAAHSRALIPRVAELRARVGWRA